MPYQYCKPCRLLLISVILLLLSCAGTMGEWKSTTLSNTSGSYQEFARKHPKDKLAREAERRVSDPDYAFAATCQIGTLGAFDGFLLSHPHSVWAPIAEQRIEFLESTVQGDLTSFKNFISNRPNNLFVSEAIAAFPVLWLKTIGGKVGVEVTVDTLVPLKGIFGGTSSEEKKREQIWKRVKEELESEGLEAVRLDIWDSTVFGPDYSTLVSIRYSEAEYEEPRSFGPRKTLAETMHEQSVKMWGEILLKPVRKASSLSVSCPSLDSFYYLSCPSLLLGGLNAPGNHSFTDPWRKLSSDGGSVNLPRVISALGNEPESDLVILMAAARNMDVASFPEWMEMAYNRLRELKTQVSSKYVK
ncbi:MAG: hypothetical protein NT028_10415 [candidate division Zixibacteria bacterium]|nr:hypothetical protein [candidate division Zixibacteria bacterium]